MERLKRRTDFQAAATGRRTAARGFVLQARRRAEKGPARIGFTVSRQVGNAVERNRVRRRLREVVRLAARGDMRSGHDYVLIGRRATLALPFEAMRRDFDTALGRLHDADDAARGDGGVAGGGHGKSLHEAGSPRRKPRRDNRAGHER